MPRYRMLLAAGVMLALLLSLTGCESKNTEYKDGEKFSPASPPADFVKEMNERRAKAAPPGKPTP